MVDRSVILTRPLVPHLDETAAAAFLGALPPMIREALEQRAAKIEFPTWAVLEAIIANALDDNATSFVDCLPEP